MKFYASDLELHFSQKFCHTHTDTHLPEIIKSCSRHPKMCKSIKNRKSKIFKKIIFSSIYIEENKNTNKINMNFRCICRISGSFKILAFPIIAVKRIFLLWCKSYMSSLKNESSKIWIVHMCNVISFLINKC